jgi:1-acyl-sn-glycerol-3-phosphate acyltransferase
MPQPTFLEKLYGAYAAVAFASVVLPLCSLIILSPAPLSRRRALGRKGMKLAMWAMGQPLKVEGVEKIPEGACVCIANHASYLDGPILTAALPARFTFVVQDGAAHWPLLGKTIQKMGVTFVNRQDARAGAKQMRELISRLQGGESFAIFPEGTFVAESGILPFKKGGLAMAQKAGVPLVVAAIVGSRNILAEGQRWIGYGPPTIRILAVLPATPEAFDQARALIAEATGEVLRDGGDANVA